MIEITRMKSKNTAIAISRKELPVFHDGERISKKHGENFG